MSSLTDEQRARIAQNKAEALRRRAERLAREAADSAGKPSIASFSVNSSSLPKSLQLKHQQQQVQPTATVSNHATKPSTSSAQGTWPIFSNENRHPLIQSSPRSAHRPPSMAILPRSKITAQFKFLGKGQRLKIVFSPFHQAVVNALKTLKTRSYDEKERCWSISLDEMKHTETVLKEIKECDVTVEPIPETALNMLTNCRLDSVPSDLSTVIDPKLIGALFPYQKEGVAFGLARSGRVLIADEMGLGKSLQALTIARYFKSEWPLLIVCPSSVKSAWKHQINTFLPYIERIHIIDKGSEPLPDSRTSNTVIIMSYDLMAQKQKALEERSYFVIILDECHMLKDGKAKRTKVATALAKKASRVIMLSGTPALSRPAELFSQIRIVNDRLFPHFQNFAIRYCEGKQGRFCFEAKGCTNSDELSAILEKRVMIRRLKNDVLKDLPDKRREVVYLTGDSIDTRMDSLQRAKAAFDASNGSAQSHDDLMEYFRITGIVKAAAVSEHILDNYFHPDSPSRKVLIFGHHQIVLDTIQSEVQKRNLRAIRIDGSTPAQERGKLCDSFQQDPEVMVAILSITAAGVGITLTAATVVVFAELHWNPGTLLQAEDRAHRVGQKDCVFVQYLVARNTADDKIWPMIQRKLDVLGQVNLSSDSFRNADSTHLECGQAPEFKRRKVVVDEDF